MGEVGQGENTLWTVSEFHPRGCFPRFGKPVNPSLTLIDRWVQEIRFTPFLWICSLLNSAWEFPWYPVSLRLGPGEAYEIGSMRSRLSHGPTSSREPREGRVVSRCWLELS